MEVVMKNLVAIAASIFCMACGAVDFTRGRATDAGGVEYAPSADAAGYYEIVSEYPDSVPDGQVCILCRYTNRNEKCVAVYTNAESRCSEVTMTDRYRLSQMMTDVRTNSDECCECVRTNMAAMLSTEIGRSVESSLNTYVDRKTGIEFKGVYYDDCLYYVPTGNVFPPNE